jgi:type VI secretion system protein ImpA
LKVLSGLLEAFWDHLYPEIEDDDLDYRIGPPGVFERQAVARRQAGAPDRPCSGGGGYSWIKWQEATGVGTMKRPWQKGKLGIEDFEKAVNRSSKTFYTELNSQIGASMTRLPTLTTCLTKNLAARLRGQRILNKALEECQRFITRTLNQKKELDPDPEPDDLADELDAESDAHDVETTSENADVTASTQVASSAASVQGQIVVGMISDTEPHEEAVWNSALTRLKNDGIKKPWICCFQHRAAFPVFDRKTGIGC